MSRADRIAEPTTPYLEAEIRNFNNHASMWQKAVRRFEQQQQARNRYLERIHQQYGLSLSAFFLTWPVVLSPLVLEAFAFPSMSWTFLLPPMAIGTTVLFSGRWRDLMPVLILWFAFRNSTELSPYVLLSVLSCHHAINLGYAVSGRHFPKPNDLRSHARLPGVSFRDTWIVCEFACLVAVFCSLVSFIAASRFPLAAPMRHISTLLLLVVCTNVYGAFTKRRTFAIVAFSTACASLFCIYSP